MSPAGRLRGIQVSARLTVAALATCAAAVAGVIALRDGGNGAEAGVAPAGIVAPVDLDSGQAQEVDRAAAIPKLAARRRHRRSVPSIPRAAPVAPPAPAAPAPAPARHRRQTRHRRSPLRPRRPATPPSNQPPPVDFLSSG